MCKFCEFIDAANKNNIDLSNADFACSFAYGYISGCQNDRFLHDLADIALCDKYGDYSELRKKYFDILAKKNNVKFSATFLSYDKECWINIIHKIILNTKSVECADFIKMLCENGVGINEKSGNGNTALIYLIARRKIQIGLEKLVEFLIKLGANVNDKNNYGISALRLHCMCEENDKEWEIIAKLLIEAGANPYEEDDEFCENSLETCKNNCEKNYEALQKIISNNKPKEVLIGELREMVVNLVSKIDELENKIKN